MARSRKPKNPEPLPAADEPMSECDHCHELFPESELSDWTGYDSDIDPPEQVCSECIGNRMMEQ